VAQPPISKRKHAARVAEQQAARKLAAALRWASMTPLERTIQMLEALGYKHRWPAEERGR